MEYNTCCICGALYYGFGNNALPVKNGRCCDRCDDKYVIPARIEEIQERKK